jgi:hypothetical protein
MGGEEGHLWCWSANQIKARPALYISRSEKLFTVRLLTVDRVAIPTPQTPTMDDLYDE